MILPHKQGRWRLGIQNRPEAWAGPRASPGLEAQQPQATAFASCHPERCGIAHKQSASAQPPNGQNPVLPTVGPMDGAAAAWPGRLD